MFAETKKNGSIRSCTFSKVTILARLTLSLLASGAGNDNWACSASPHTLCPESGKIREEGSLEETESRKDEFGQETLTCGSLETRARGMLTTPDTSRPTRAGSTN